MGDENMNLSVAIDNPCTEKKNFCINCNSHFMAVRPSLKSVVVSKRFVKDLKDQEKASSIIRNILDCAHLEFHELHKFERNINGNLIFRARKEKLHIVYGIDKAMRIIFLRAIKNFTEYKKFLEDRKEILRMIVRTQ
jgi:mRNA-degrading endonuclease RelE of RelBE toxin-antitoxin system